MFTARDQVVDVLALAAVCHEHTLLLGPPGTGKSELVARFTEAIDAPFFGYLCTRFTEPSELFGPLDVEAFQGGRYHIRTEGMLPAATVGFLDEVFQGSSAILNTLLTLVHERVFHNGAERQRVPLITLVGASNELPSDDTLRAFSDRFALRVQLDPVPERKLDELLDKGWMIELERMEAEQREAAGARPRALPTLAESALRELYARLREVSLAAARPRYRALLRELRAEGVTMSDRRVVKGLKLIAGAALLDGRAEATDADLWPLGHMWATLEEADVVGQLVDQFMREAGAPVAPLRREFSELEADLALIQQRAARHRGESTTTRASAIGAHLMALGRLRREAIIDHPEQQPLRAAIEAAIEAAMGALEGARA